MNLTLPKNEWLVYNCRKVLEGAKWHKLIVYIIYTVLHNTLFHERSTQLLAARTMQIKSSKDMIFKNEKKNLL